MRRRQFATLGVAGVFLGTGSRAQQLPNLPRIGWLWYGRSTGPPDEVAGFRQGLKNSARSMGRTSSSITASRRAGLIA